MAGLVDDFDPNELFGTGLVDESARADESALQRVATKISAQYAEIIAQWSRRVLSTPEPADTEGIRANVGNLLRLADSSHNTTQSALLAELDATLEAMHGTSPASRVGDQTRLRLRDWIPAFAATLDGEDGARLRALVEWDDSHTPFLDELLRVRGVGPRRLTRLYSAGLAQIDEVANARPLEVAQVTGIPLAVAEEVVSRAQLWAGEERQRCVSEIRERAARLEMLVTRVRHHPNQDLVAAAIDALARVETAFGTLIQKDLP